MAQHEEYFHWSHTAAEVRLLMLDGRCAFTIPIFLLHMSKSTFLLMIATCFMFWMLERYGLSLVDFFRMLRFKVGALGTRHMAIAPTDRSSIRYDYFRYAAGARIPFPER